ncbi:MAG: hypothetical protein FWF11_05250 [Coriobacteriia bacterium]|nr:hypothetical protein [Coriobacteriia bacterium]
MTTAQSEKKIPVWAIVLVVLGAISIIALCCLAVLGIVGYAGLFDDRHPQNTYHGDSFQPEIFQPFDTDPTVLAAIVGEYEVTTRYGGSDEDFWRDEYLGDGEYFTFADDLTFSIAFDARYLDEIFLQGTFSAQRIRRDQIGEQEKRSMPFIDQRSGADWYRIVLHPQQRDFRHGFEIFLSRQSNDDIILYIPYFLETSVVTHVR